MEANIINAFARVQQKLELWTQFDSHLLFSQYSSDLGLQCAQCVSDLLNIQNYIHNRRIKVKSQILSPD
jgi:hypothetical protein